MGRGHGTRGVLVTVGGEEEGRPGWRGILEAGLLGGPRGWGIQGGGVSWDGGHPGGGVSWGWGVLGPMREEHRKKTYGAA